MDRQIKVTNIFQLCCKVLKEHFKFLPQAKKKERKKERKINYEETLQEPRYEKLMHEKLV